MKKLFFMTIAAIAALFCGCTADSGEGGGALYADFTINPNPCYASEVVTFTNTTKGAKSCSWDIIDIDTNSTIDKLVGELVGGKLQATYSFISNGTYRIKMTVSDGSSTVEKVKILVVNPAKLEDTGNLVLNWCGKMEGYSARTVPAVDDSGNVYAICNDYKLRKFDAKGDEAWVIQFEKNDAQNEASVTCTPAIDTDGTIYVGVGGAKGEGRYVAVNPDGTIKWTFTDFYVCTAHGTLAPAVNGQHVVITDQYIYAGNNGNTGSVLAIEKATGTRKAYAATDSNGGGGPAGGVASGIAMDKSGYIYWSAGQYGLFNMLATDLSSAAISSNAYSRVFTAEPYKPGKADANLACTNIGGINCVCSVMTDGIGTNVYAVDGSNTVVSQKYIDNTDTQDQGGVAITAEGYVVASLNNTLGKANGGIVVVDLAKEQVLARFSTMEKVSGSPAVDAAGNIHFGTESGHYYIVKVEGETCKLLVKRNIATLLAADSRYASHYEGLEYPKMWSSPVIGPDGKIYINFCDDERRDAVSGGALSGVLCLSYEGCTGPADSSWPMHGANHRHQGVQLK